MKSVWRLKSEIPLHARGEYGAKVARRSPTNDAEKMARRTKDYFAQAADGPGRKQINDDIHRTVVAKPRACLSCHAKEPGMLDFAALGYSPNRAAALRSLPLASLLEQIRQGETFQLPKLMEGSNDR
jgi:hypothetical protein